MQNPDKGYLRERKLRSLPAGTGMTRLLTPRLRKESLTDWGPLHITGSRRAFIGHLNQSCHSHPFPYQHFDDAQVQPLCSRKAPRRCPATSSLQSTCTASILHPKRLLMRVCLQSGCVTCRIRRKRCDEELDANGACTTCARLQIECLGFTAKRPDWCRVSLPFAVACPTLCLTPLPLHRTRPSLTRTSSI